MPEKLSHLNKGHGAADRQIHGVDVARTRLAALPKGSGLTPAPNSTTDAETEGAIMRLKRGGSGRA